MILVTGGRGFIGSHTVKALLEMGESCVLVQRRPGAELPEFLTGGGVAVEQGDVTDLDRLREIGARHKITGIVHLAGSMPWPPSSEPPVEASRRALGGLFNLVEVAQEWEVKRMSVASTIGVYIGGGKTDVYREDMPLAMTSPHLIPTFKKVGELLNDHLADATGLSIINCRISATWGPLGHADRFFPAPELIRAAVSGGDPDFTNQVHPPHAEDAIDLCYVKDTGRAIASLQLANRLNYRTYNVGAGRATTNAEVVAAIQKAVPATRLELPTGSGSGAAHLDITRLLQDTEYRPQFDVDLAAADYIQWLRAGNPS